MGEITRKKEAALILKDQIVFLCFLYQCLCFRPGDSKHDPNLLTIQRNLPGEAQLATVNNTSANALEHRGPRRDVRSDNSYISLSLGMAHE